MSAIWAVTLCSTPILLSWGLWYRRWHLRTQQPRGSRPSFAPVAIHERTFGDWHFTAFASGASFLVRVTYFRPGGGVGQAEFSPEQFAVLAMAPVSAELLDQGACLVSLDGRLVVDLVTYADDVYLRARRPRDVRPEVVLPIAEVPAWCTTAWEFLDECAQRSDLPGPASNGIGRSPPAGA